MKFVGRSRPYTVAEMKRRRCYVCGARAIHQWQCCANDNRYIPLCLSCDIALNEMALAFFRIPGRATMMAAYRKRRAHQ